jgi:hypothetical protein
VLYVFPYGLDCGSLAVRRMQVYTREMGFLSRLLVPRSVRRAMHPGRAVKRAVTPKAVKRARRAMHPVSNAIYDVERSMNTKRRRTSNSSSTITAPAR